MCKHSGFGVQEGVTIRMWQQVFDIVARKSDLGINYFTNAGVAFVFVSS